LTEQPIFPCLNFSGAQLFRAIIFQLIALSSACMSASFGMPRALASAIVTPRSDSQSITVSLIKT
jgi:hypothetical protein